MDHSHVSLKTQIDKLTLSSGGFSPADVYTLDLSVLDPDGPLYHNAKYDRPLDVGHVTVITDMFNQRRLGAVRFIMELNAWVMENLGSVPKDAIYPNPSLSSASNPAVVDMSIDTFLLAVRIMDKFFAAGASVSSLQRALSFNVWKECEFSPEENDTLLVYASMCLMISCKVLCSVNAPRFSEIAQLIQDWKHKSTGGLFPETTAKKLDSKAGDCLELNRLKAAERLVVDECGWGLTMITAMDVINEAAKESVDDPRFQQLKTLSVANAIRLTFDAKFVYSATTSTTRIAVLAISEAQLTLADIHATPPTCIRNKKRSIADVEEPCVSPAGTVPCKAMQVDTPSVSPANTVPCNALNGMHGEAMLMRWVQIDAALCDVVQRFLQTHNPFEGGS